MPAHLSPQFTGTDKTDWEKQARKELKGKFETATQRDSGSGLCFEAYVTEKDLDPQQVAEMQAAQKKIPGWLNTPAISLEDPAGTNLSIKNALANGATAVMLDLGESPVAKCEFPKLLHGIRLSDTPVFFQTKENPEELFGQISKHAGYYLKGGVAFDAIANQLRTGNAFESDLEKTVTLLNHTRNMREFRAYAMESHIFHNNGADPVQEAAFTLASFTSTLDFLTDAGIPALLAFNRALFTISIGPEYLTEIAKLRAMRFLLRKIARAYQLPDELCSPFILAKTSSFYHTHASPYTNLVRATSEAMSAVIGGCNALTIAPYEQFSHQKSDFAQRIARNVSPVMSFESNLEAVADPAAGSYLLENLSLRIAEKAWELFLNVEERGGLISCFNSGFVADQLKRSLTQKCNAMKNGKVIVGVNKFSEPTDPNSTQNNPEPNRTSENICNLVDLNFSEYYQTRSAPQ